MQCMTYSYTKLNNTRGNNNNNNYISIEYFFAENSYAVWCVVAIDND